MADESTTTRPDLGSTNGATTTTRPDAASTNGATTKSRRDAASVGEVIDYVKTYAKQETLGPLKGAGKWIGVGAGAAACLGLGLLVLMLGLLRLLQTESWGFQSSSWSWVNYLIVLAVCALLLALTLWRINQKYLNKEDKR